MFDFLKTQICDIPPKTIYNNPLLDFNQPVNLKTGELKGKEIIADYHSLKFCINDMKYIELRGSLHKYWNPKCQNFNDYTINDFYECVFELFNNFGLNPFKMNLRNVEFGVNVKLPFNTKTFLDSIISFKGKEYELETFNNSGYLLRFKFGNYYELKIYDKGKQYGLNENILRFEIKVRKMYFLHSKGIEVKTLADLLKPNTQNRLKDLLIKSVKELLVYNDEIFLDGIQSKWEREILLNGRNPKFWQKLKSGNPNTYKKKRSQYKKLVLEYTTRNFHKEVSTLIECKLTELTSASSSIQTKINWLLSNRTFTTVPNLTAIKFPPYKFNRTQFDTSSIRSISVH